MLKKIFNNRILNNQRGSTLTITIVVIAVLTFSITSITKLTINLSGSTSSYVDNVNDEAIGKGLIIEAIGQFQSYIDNSGTFEDFNNVEIPRLLSELTVIVEDVTDLFPEFGETAEATTMVYKFAYLLDNGDTLYKYVYVSTTGSSYDTYDPYEFALGTEGDLILNGGVYEDLMMFGNNVYLSSIAPFTEDDLTYIGDTDHITPYSSGSYPVFTVSNIQSEIFYGQKYQYCTIGCYTVTEDSSSPMVINKSVYQDVEGSSLSDQGNISNQTISSFFNDFSFEDFAMEYATEVMPTGNMVINDPINLDNFASVILANSGTVNRNRFPNTPYVDVTNYNRYTPWDSNESLNYSYVYNGDLTISNRHEITDADGEGLIVLGDLHLDNDSSRKTARIRGTYLVTGDLYLDGYSLNFNKATFIVFGETHINLNYGSSFNTWSQNYELSIIGMDNIIILGNNEDDQVSTPSLLTMLLYSEESIFIDAVESKYNMEGAIFARAAGVSGNYLDIEDEYGVPIQGIVINSYRGYVDESYTFNWWTWDWEKDITFVPSNNLSANRFYLTDVPYTQFQQTFMNIPDHENVTVTDGTFTYETSEWKKE
jgi:hypothetical protein